jgi:hypothetical protein
MLTYASIRQHTHARWLSPSPMYASIRSAYVSIRQHTSAYVSIRLCEGAGGDEEEQDDELRGRKGEQGGGGGDPTGGGALQHTQEFTVYAR